jgi:aspartyl-tRNA(Asn)/glutamyl-tRNA(Gln) amidotransferase subunit C
MISLADIEKLANLSRIQLEADEKESLRSQIDAILGYIDQIKKASLTSNTEPQVGNLHNVLRDDTNVHESGFYTEKILTEAPHREGNYLKVKKILG